LRLTESLQDYVHQLLGRAKVDRLQKDKDMDIVTCVTVSEQIMTASMTITTSWQKTVQIFQKGLATSLQEVYTEFLPTIAVLVFPNRTEVEFKEKNMADESLAEAYNTVIQQFDAKVNELLDIKRLEIEDIQRALRERVKKLIFEPLTLLNKEENTDEMAHSSSPSSSLTWFDVGYLTFNQEVVNAKEKNRSTKSKIGDMFRLRKPRDTKEVHVVNVAEVRTILADMLKEHNKQIVTVTKQRLDRHMRQELDQRFTEALAKLNRAREAIVLADKLKDFEVEMQDLYDNLVRNRETLKRNLKEVTIITRDAATK